MKEIPILICAALLASAATSGRLAAGAEKESYLSVVTPNGATLPWTLDNGVKVYHLIAEKVKREFAPGLNVNCWGYNGQTPGPTIEAVEGDRVRIYVTNKLDAPTTVHWHGIIVPNGMDGVSGLTQPAIKPGETFKYEFTLKQHGTFMYHPHFDEMTQIGMGMGGFFIIHPKEPAAPKVERDFAIMLMEWFIPIGAATPDPTVMLDFNYFTFNSKVFPGTAALVIKKGQRVRIRLANLSMDNHPIHIHGTSFKITGRTGASLPENKWEDDDTVDVPVGSTRDIEFVIDEPGDWPLHCHKTHHTMSGMEHGLPNVLGVELGGSAKKIEKLLPGYMEMGNAGMGNMMNMGGPPNTLPMSAPGPFGDIEMGGMFTVVKVREDITSYDDPGWYKHPECTVAKLVPESEVPKDK